MEGFLIENGKLTHYQGTNIHVVIPDNVTSVGDHAFEGCSCLKSVQMPDSVTEIGEYAFKDCSSLTEVIFSSKLTTIGQYAFTGCTDLKEVNLPVTLWDIGGGAFEGCKSLISVQIPYRVSVLPHSVFKNCGSLTDVVLSKQLYWIFPDAFRGCKQLKNIDFPKKDMGIENGAFKGCASLESIYIPGWYSLVSNHAFADCANLKQVLIQSIGTTIKPKSFDARAKITVENFDALREVREIEPTCLQCNIDIPATDFDRACLLLFQGNKSWLSWIISTTVNPEEVLIACHNEIKKGRKGKKLDSKCVKRIVEYMLVHKEKLSSESIDRMLCLMEAKGGKPDRSGFDFVDDMLNRSCSQSSIKVEKPMIDVPRNIFSDKMCRPNECLLFSKDNAVLETIAGKFPDIDSYITIYSINPECRFMTMPLEPGEPLEITLREIADELVGKGILVARMHDDEHDLREFAFFDGSSIWLGDEDDLRKLNAGRLSDAAVDANEWQIATYDDEEEEDWSQQDSVWDAVKKKIIKYTLHDFVCFYLNRK